MSYAGSSANCCDYEWMKPNSTRTILLYVVLRFKNMLNQKISKTLNSYSVPVWLSLLLSFLPYQLCCNQSKLNCHVPYHCMLILNWCHWRNCSSGLCMSCKCYVRQILLLWKQLRHMRCAVSEGKQAQWEAELEKELEQQRQEQRRSRAISQNVSHRSPQRRPYSWWWYLYLWILS